MNNAEAIDMIQNDIKLHHDYLSGTYRKALNIAIKALEKQIPKKFLWDDGNPVCPVCREEVWDMEWCNNCGQKLDRKESKEY